MKKDITKEKNSTDINLTDIDINDGTLPENEKASGKKRAAVTVAVCVLLLAAVVVATVIFLPKRTYDAAVGNGTDDTADAATDGVTADIPVFESDESHVESDTAAYRETTGADGETTGGKDSSFVPHQSGEPGDAQGAGEAVSVRGDAVVPADMDAVRFVKQGYELRVLFAVNSFSAPEDMSVNQLVQYAFCYLYSGDECLCDHAAGKMALREAPESELRGMITALFGSCPADLTGADLYNKSRGQFEMWQPNYKTDVFADAVVTSPEKDTWKLTADYFADSGKSEKTASCTVTVKKSSDGYYISALG